MEKNRECYAGGGSMKLVPLLHNLLQSAVYPLSLMEHIHTNYGKRLVNGNLLFIPSYVQARTYGTHTRFRKKESSHDVDYV